ncbi:MAG: hypothetical protein LBW85_10335 [Deltaproteobacteria bacterium]|jgi:4-amino-4-deoxychorismate lyase|nr:hypothetical protein [Deltaproteobacteria bacterium]
MEKPVFIENIKAENGEYFNLQGHAVRMDRTIRRFFRHPFMQFSLQRLLPAPPHSGKSKLTVLYADDIISAEFSPFEKPSISSLAMVDAGQFDYIFKSQNREPLQQILNFAGTDEAIIVRNGFITNATTANLVFRDLSDALFTPLHYIHSGTKRELYVKSKVVTTYPIKHDQLESYRTVTLVNAMLDLEDDVTFPCSRIAPLVTMPPLEGS